MPILINNPFFLAVSFLSIVNLVLLAVMFRQFAIYRKRQVELLQGEEVTNLEDLVLKHKKLLATHNKNLKELGVILEELVAGNKLNIQKVGIIRFNPFTDAGGNMSFAMALLDGQNNGIVISSLHARESTRIYAKAIENSQSKHHLSDEEKQAIEKAKSDHREL